MNSNVKPTVSGLVLAAGKGTRMKSDMPKALHAICGLPLTEFVLRALKSIGVSKPIVVIGHQAERVAETLGDDYEYVVQEQQLGTGHAVMQAEKLLKNSQDPVLICPGDAPLITPDALEKLLLHFVETNSACAVATVRLNDPTGYGRIIRNSNGDVVNIIEEKDADISIKAINEVNSGYYCFNPSTLFAILPQLQNKNAQNEYYLTDVLALMAPQGMSVAGICFDDPEILMGVNSRWDLAASAKAMRRRINKNHAEKGVTFIDPDTAYIDVDVEIGKDTTIQPMTILEGKTIIGEECNIGPYTRINKSVIGNQTSIMSSNLNNAVIENNVRVGPFANLRDGSIVRSRAVVGDFVELKNSELHEGASAAHLSYIGDAEIGEKTNIGAGTITCNYDGYKKHRTNIGNNAFIGSNSTLVAPVEIGDNAFIAAGSVITDEVPSDSLGIARSRQTIKEGWSKAWRERK